MDFNEICVCEVWGNTRTCLGANITWVACFTRLGVWWRPSLTGKLNSPMSQAHFNRESYLSLEPVSLWSWSHWESSHHVESPAGCWGGGRKGTLKDLALPTSQDSCEGQMEVKHKLQMPASVTTAQPSLLFTITRSPVHVFMSTLCSSLENTRSL